jgi:hypothetical protein
MQHRRTIGLAAETGTSPSGSTWYQSVGIHGTEAPAWTRRCKVGKDTPSEIQQNLGVPVEIF